MLVCERLGLPVEVVQVLDVNGMHFPYTDSIPPKEQADHIADAYRESKKLRAHVTGGGIDFGECVVGLGDE